MQVRILKPTEGVMDRVSLRHLVPGFVYDVEPSLAQFLVSEGAAEEVREPTSDLVTALDDETDVSRLTGGINVSVPTSEPEA